MLRWEIENTCKLGTGEREGTPAVKYNLFNPSPSGPGNPLQKWPPVLLRLDLCNALQGTFLGTLVGWNEICHEILIIPLQTKDQSCYVLWMEPLSNEMWRTWNFAGEPAATYPLLRSHILVSQRSVPPGFRFFFLFAGFCCSISECVCMCVRAPNPT